jgi:hypothetical protein
VIIDRARPLVEQVGLAFWYWGCSAEGLGLRSQMASSVLAMSAGIATKRKGVSSTLGYLRAVCELLPSRQRAQGKARSRTLVFHVEHPLK